MESHISIIILVSLFELLSEQGGLRSEVVLNEEALNNISKGCICGEFVLAGKPVLRICGQRIVCYPLDFFVAQTSYSEYICFRVKTLYMTQTFLAIKLLR